MPYACRTHPPYSRRRRASRVLTLIALVLALFPAVQASRALAQTPVNSYTITALGGLSGGGGSTAYGINGAGEVVGSSQPPILGVSSHAFLWKNGVMTDLGTLGGADSEARAINNSGQVAGWADGPTGRTAFRWDPAAGMLNLGTLGGNSSAASGINDIGQLVGNSVTAAGVTHAFLWQKGQMVDLGLPAGYLSSIAYSINASGQIVGLMGNSTTTNAFLWTPTIPNGTTGTMVALDATSINTAYGVNSAGNAVGNSAAAGGFSLPTLWSSSGGASSLPLLDTMTYGVASGINDNGQIVGQNSYDYWDDYGNSYTSNDAFVWDAVHGTRELGALTGGLAIFDDARAINASGQIAAGAGGAAFLLTPSPLPTRPSLSESVGDTRVNLSWNASSAADSYTVERSATSGGPYTILSSGITGTSYTDTSVTNGVSYYYVVLAVNTYGQSANSNEVTAVPTAPPAAPTGLTALAGNQQVSLSWNSSAGASAYSIYRSTSPGGPYVWIDTAYAASYVDYWADYATNVPLQNGTTYYYVVTALDAGGTSGYSNEASATPALPPPPPAPTGITAAASDSQVALSWNVSSGASGYYVKRAATSGGPYGVTATVPTGSSYTDTGVVNGNTYYYVVSAFNTGGEGPNSNQAGSTPTGPPPPAPPTSLTAAIGKKTGTIALKWKQSTSAGITQNRIYRSTTSGGIYMWVATIPAGTSFGDKSLTSGLTYFYVVTAVDSRVSLPSGQSSFSNQAAAKAK